MSKDREAVLTDLTSRIFSAMLGEIAMDTTIQAQNEARRINSLCRICGMRCGQAHATSATAPVPGSSRAASPPIDGSSQPGTSTPGGSGKTDGNINLDCVHCQRPVASNRYAQHLATCLGIGTGVRRTAQRNAVTKTKSNASNARSASPYIDEPDDPRPTKGKGKGKNKTAGADDEFVGNQKRPGTPQSSPPKKQKKGKGASAAPGTGPPRPVTRLGPPGSNPKSSSKLRSTPTPSVASHFSKNSQGSQSVNSDSSDAEGGGDSGAEMESHSSVIGGISPSLPAAETIGRGRSKTGSFSHGPGSASSATRSKKVTGTGPPAKKLPPAAHQLSSIPPPPPPPIRRPETTSNYVIDIEGDETGSDTD